MQPLPTNARLLGFPDESPLLIVNADDLGMCHSINIATFEAIRHGIVTTTSLMAPCPWAWEAMHMLAAEPAVPFGVHLTLVNEMPGYRWGPVAPTDQVPSLVNSDGYFRAHAEIPALYRVAALDEVEREFRAQIERVLRFGLKPTHLDWHCVLDGGRPDILELTIRLCDDYGLAMRVNGPPLRDRLLAVGKPANDTTVIDGYGMPLATKNDRWADLLRTLPPGLHQFAVHVSTGDAEAQAMEPTGWQVRATDFDFFVSPQAKAIVEERGIRLLDYRGIQRIWSEGAGRAANSGM